MHIVRVVPRNWRGDSIKLIVALYCQSRLLRRHGKLSLRFVSLSLQVSISNLVELGLTSFVTRKIRDGDALVFDVSLGGKYGRHLVDRVWFDWISVPGFQIVLLYFFHVVTSHRF